MSNSHLALTVFIRIQSSRKILLTRNISRHPKLKLDLKMCHVHTVCKWKTFRSVICQSSEITKRCFYVFYHNSLFLHLPHQDRPGWRQWAEFLLMYFLLPYQLLSAFAWHWLSVHNWTARIVIFHALLLSVQDVCFFWTLLKRGEMRYKHTEKRKERCSPCLMTLNSISTVRAVVWRDDCCVCVTAGRSLWGFGMRC